MSDGALDNQLCVLVIDDDESVREAVSFLLKSVGLKVKTYPSAKTFIAEYDPNQRGCIVSDIRMPGMSGISLQQELLKRHATQPIIFITGHGDIPMAVEAVKNGAIDFHTKPFRDQDLLDSIDIAMERNAQILEEMDQQNAIQNRLETLTHRERQVLEMVIEGKSSKMIAEELHLSPRTVEVHRSHMMEKMQVQTVVELVKLM